MPTRGTLPCGSTALARYQSWQHGGVPGPAVYHLIGYPGVGKFTVATALAATTADDDPSRIVVVDNHLTGNPVLRITQLDEQGRVPQRAWDLIADIRAIVRTAIGDLSPAGWSFVFTNLICVGDEQAEPTIGGLRALARSRGCPYVPVLLRCDRDEMRRRVASPGRAERHKWTDPDAVLAYTDESDLFEPGDLTTLDLDVTSMPPTDAAAAILDHRSRLVADQATGAASP